MFWHCLHVYVVRTRTFFKLFSFCRWYLIFLFFSFILNWGFLISHSTKLNRRLESHLVECCECVLVHALCMYVCCAVYICVCVCVTSFLSFDAYAFVLHVLSARSVHIVHSAMQSMLLWEITFDFSVHADTNKCKREMRNFDARDGFFLVYAFHRS